MSALRVARAATGRDRIVKFAGHYHGHVDGAARPGRLGAGHSRHPGKRRGDTPPDWGHRDRDVERPRLGRGSARRPIAAVICEPLPANMGLVPAEDGFLEFLREATERAGALLIFDEVISGFRAQLELPPADLVVLGKVIGGGLPLAAYAGRADLMRLVAPAGDVYQAGTLSGNPLATAAGLATLRLLDADAYARLQQQRRGSPTGSPPLDERISRRLAPGARHAVLPRRAAARLRRRQAAAISRPTRRSRAACWTAACTRRLPVRGLVPVARPHRGARRADHRGRTPGTLRAVSALAEVQRGPSPRLPRHAVDGAERALRRPSSWRPSTRATSSTTASRAASPGMDEDLAPACRRFALRARSGAAGRGGRPRRRRDAGRPDHGRVRKLTQRATRLRQ